jgi:hypothetical protein
MLGVSPTIVMTLVLWFMRAPLAWTSNLDCCDSCALIGIMNMGFGGMRTARHLALARGIMKFGPFVLTPLRFLRLFGFILTFLGFLRPRVPVWACPSDKGSGTA